MTRKSAIAGARIFDGERFHDQSALVFSDGKTEAIVPDSGHWIMEENPAATIAIVRGFLGKGR